MRRRSRTSPGPPEDPSPGAGDLVESGRPADAERLAGYRLVRRIAAGERADVYLAAVVERTGAPAEVAAAEDGSEGRGLVALRVYERDADADAITTEVEAMALVSALPTLLDLATLADGRTCVVVERLAGPTLAAVATGSGLTAGEAVTVLAPIVLAVHELERHGFAHVRLALSDVMFDGAGRPRVIGTGGLRRLDAAADHPGARTALVREMYAALARFVSDVAAITRPPRALDPVRHLLDELLAVRPFRTHAEELERMLFTVAAPAPVAVGPGSAVRATGSRHRSTDAGVVPLGATPSDAAPNAAGARRPTAAAPAIGAVVPPAPERRWLPRALSSFDALIHDALPEGDPQAQEASRVRKAGARLRGVIAARRPVLVFGGLAGGAALVLALTLVPPSADPSTAVHEGLADATTSDSAALTDESPAAPDHEPEPPAGGAADGAAVPNTQTDAAAAAAELLRRREGCFAAFDPGCLDGLVQPGSGLDGADRAALAAAPADSEAADRPDFALEAARVTGEMGGAWLIEVPYREPERQPASILVMRSEAGWRLREIFG